MKRYHRWRILVEDIEPAVQGGRFPIKREVGDILEVHATIVHEGHDVWAADLLFRPRGQQEWFRVPMRSINPGLDRWSASFPLEEVTTYYYTFEAWPDRYATWLEKVRARHGAGEDVGADWAEGQRLVSRLLRRARSLKEKEVLRQVARLLQRVEDVERTLAELGNETVLLAARRCADKAEVYRHEPALAVVVDRVQARFATWYELFPRSQTPDPARSGTFLDVIARLDDLRDLGFDVIYLPPIHPIGRTHRKGKNGTLVAGPDDPGSPWAIGNESGGHYSIEPSLGTLEDFRRLVQEARQRGMEIALDFAIQCSPDHPYVRQHPEWFYRYPDGSIRYAENPPKKYHDIYPLDFETADWPALWREMQAILEYWIAQGVEVFRVDNPHTKPLGFWAWLIESIKQKYPRVIFLAEAFTRPAVMKALAKVGFTQSYTYFTWRNTRQELESYFRELMETDMVEYFRGHLFANTPDILPVYLQKGGRPAFKIRYILAGTLSSLCGIYSGYELCENVPLREGSEEYLDSEKYQIRVRDWQKPGHIRDFIRAVNRARKQHPALQLYRNLRFHDSTDEHILCYSKATPDFRDAVIVVVNLDPHRVHDGVVRLHLEHLGLAPQQTYRVHDELTGQTWTWRGAENYVRLDPQQEPAHLLVVQR
ncbi:MAG: alpha-1,4-glucan--maltose-1-phosphate maltosyltransferase [Gemmataceae bacterium]